MSAYTEQQMDLFRLLFLVRFSTNWIDYRWFGRLFFQSILLVIGEEGQSAHSGEDSHRRGSCGGGTSMVSERSQCWSKQSK